MKLGLSVVLGLFAAQFSAHATSFMPPRWDAKLTHMSLDSQLSYGQQVEAASIHLDYQKKTASLEMQQRFFCPTGEVCAQVMPMPVVVTLPIVVHRTEQCGTRTVVATLDRRAVDGALETLTIHDNTSNHCPTFAKLEATEVFYDTDATGRAGEVKTHSTFSGDALRPNDSPSED